MSDTENTVTIPCERCDSLYAAPGYSDAPNLCPECLAEIREANRKMMEAMRPPKGTRGWFDLAGGQP